MSYTILVVDDMQDARTLLRLLLTHRGENYTILEAANGNEALQIAENEVPDLIILDYMMPDISGIEVCQQIRQTAHTKHIPVLVLTARTDQNTQNRALEAGANSFMSKPIKPPELIAEVRKLLG